MTTEGQASRGTTRWSALVGAAAVVVGMVVASAPAAASARPQAAKPTSVSLETSDATVKSSTGRSLHVAVEASNNPSTPANDDVNVVLSSGAEDQSETHSWTFPISASVLRVARNGAGTLKVPSKDIAPFGSINLAIKPIGKITSRSCHGQVTSQSARVLVSGALFFDSESTGKDKWGTVGSKQPFTFPATNTLTWLFSSATSEDCIATTAPCPPDLTWSAQANGVAFDGVTTSQSSTVRASRAVTLSKPHGAMRNDTNVVATTQPTVAMAGTPPTLTVSGAGTGATGTATITGSTAATEITIPCNGSNSTGYFFQGTYANGSPPLNVAEQIYGTLTLTGEDISGTVSQTAGT